MLPDLLGRDDVEGLLDFDAFAGTPRPGALSSTRSTSFWMPSMTGGCDGLVFAGALAVDGGGWCALDRVPCVVLSRTSSGISTAQALNTYYITLHLGEAILCIAPPAEWRRQRSYRTFTMVGEAAGSILNVHADVFLYSHAQNGRSPGRCCVRNML